MLLYLSRAAQLVFVGAAPTKASRVMLSVVDHLLGSGIGLSLKVLAFEHEGKLFERPTHSFREHKVDEADLECEPAAVRNEVLPANVLETDGVDKSGEEAGQTTKELENGNTTGALGIRPDFHHVGCPLS